MRLDKFIGPGSTTPRRKFWDTVVSAVLAAEKKEGKNVSVDVHDGFGSMISVNPQRSGKTGACCIDGECSITTRSDCNDSGGNYLGDDTTCDDVDCTVGPCCVDGECSLTTEEECTGHFLGYGETCDGVDCTQGACCAPDGSCTVTTLEDCTDDYQGDGTDCEPNPCTTPGPCVCGGFLNPEDGLYYKRKIYNNTVTADCPDAGPCCIAFDTGNSCCSPWTGARWYFRDFCVDSVLAEEYYDAECNLVQVFEDLPVDVFYAGHCRGEGGVAVPDCGGTCDCEETDCEHQACPPADPCTIPGWEVCGTIDTVISYEDLCIP